MSMEMPQMQPNAESTMEQRKKYPNAERSLRQEINFYKERFGTSGEDIQATFSRRREELEEIKKNPEHSESKKGVADHDLIDLESVEDAYAALEAIKNGDREMAIKKLVRFGTSGRSNAYHVLKTIGELMEG